LQGTWPEYFSAPHTDATNARYQNQEAFSFAVKYSKPFRVHFSVQSHGILHNTASLLMFAAFLFNLREKTEGDYAYPQIQILFNGRNCRTVHILQRRQRKH
jgi:hypothetical protein